MILRRWIVPALLLPAGLCASLVLAGDPAPITFPSDSCVVDVTGYGAIPNDGADDTAAIQKAFDENVGNGSVIYLPPGTYHIRDTIRWRGRQSDNILQGAGESFTTLRLMDGSDGFGDPKRPKDMIYTGGPPAQRFRNAVRDLTIDCGDGNAGAVGLSFCANNQGCVRNVTIRSGADGDSPGAVGLALDEPEVGPLLVKDVTVIGFDTGIRVRHSVNSVTLESIRLRKQRVFGIDNFNNYVFCRKLDSDNSVAAVANGGNEGVITLIDSQLRGSGPAAILNRHAAGILYVRNVTAEGYDKAIAAESLPPVAAGEVGEWVSAAPLSLFPGEIRGLNLPIIETPAVPVDPIEGWISPAAFGGIPGDGKDDTEAIQKAIDSGATTIYLPRAKENKNVHDPGRNGSYELSDTIHLRGKARRIVGLEAKLEITKKLQAEPEKPVFVFENGESPVVVIERLKFMFAKTKNPAFIHRADRDLVISSFSGLAETRHEGKGRLFLEDVVGHYLYAGPGSTIYARQLNLEGPDLKLENNAGTIWALGLKTESRSPIALTRDGGVSEIIGGHLYKCVRPGIDEIAFELRDAKMSLAGVAEYVWDRQFATRTLLKETRDGQTRTLGMAEAPDHGNAGAFPLLACFPAEIRGTAPATPKVSVVEATAGSLTLEFRADDPDNDLAGFIISRDDKPIGRARVNFVEKGLAPDTNYTYTVIAYDHYGQQSPPTMFQAATPPDTVAPSPPENLHTLNVTDQHVQLMWRGGRDEIGVKRYVVERSEDDKTWRELTRQVGLEYDDRAVVKGAAYAYRVIALDAAGNRSAPAELKVATLAGPPMSIKQEAERYDIGNGNIKKSWYLFNLHVGCWMVYKQLELGREQPFDHLTLRYGAPASRQKARVLIYLDPVVEEKGDKRTLSGGEKIAEFIVQSTGSWEKFGEFTQPVKISKPGRHDVALVIERGESKEPNALVNIDWFTFSAGPPKPD